MISEPKIDYREEKLYMGIRTVAPFKGMFAEVDRLLKDLRKWVKQHGIADEGPFFLRYHVIDMNGSMDIEVGFMVSEHLPGDARVKPGVLPSGNYATLTYRGSGLAGNKALMGWAKANGIAWDRWDDPAGDAFRCRYEAYLTADKLQPRKSKGVDLAIKIAERRNNMRKLVVLEHISLDGVIQAPGGPDEDTSGGFAYGGWIAPYSDDVLGAALRKQMNLPFDLLLGRKTFDIWAPYWPHHRDAWPGVNTATKYVASTTRTSSDWQPSVFLNGDVAEKVAQLKEQSGPDLHVWGSSGLLQTLLEHDLVDTFWLMIYPLTLGGGKQLFDVGTIPAAFKVTESQVSPSGVMVVNYERAGAITTGSL